MKRITLTFDNGPHLEGTPHLLQVLADRSLTATFFLVGDNLRDPALRELAVQIRAAGHRIANHTMTHGVALGRRPGIDVAEAEIGDAQALLGELATSKLFRPSGDRGQLGPHLLSEDAVNYLQAHGFTAVSWNCVPQDWIGAPGAWVQRAEAIMRTQDWSAIVLHDHCLAGSMQYLEGFLDRVAALGYGFTQDFPPECLLIDNGRRTAALEGSYTPAPPARA
ncbi:MAG TPA: polysaccharide deacetylase family protein [Ramlibacter sp.]|nr:polysaccharide deacetylase family protein [Ramlibacter sp.]